jgi:hypothetical protein
MAFFDSFIPSTAANIAAWVFIAAAGAIPTTLYALRRRRSIKVTVSAVSIPFPPIPFDLRTRVRMLADESVEGATELQQVLERFPLGIATISVRIINRRNAPSGNIVLEVPRTYFWHTKGRGYVPARPTPNKIEVGDIGARGDVTVTVIADSYWRRPDVKALVDNRYIKVFFDNMIAYSGIFDLGLCLGRTLVQNPWLGNTIVMVVIMLASVTVMEVAFQVLMHLLGR